MRRQGQSRDRETEKETKGDRERETDRGRQRETHRKRGGKRRSKRGNQVSKRNKDEREIQYSR